MMRALGILMLSAAMGAAGLLPAEADDKPEIKGGIEGKVEKVDVDKETLTITVNGKDRTFTVTDDTTIVGPRGGLVRRRLKDPRFHPGLEITVVAEGKAAKELHLGIDRKGSEEAVAEPKSPTKAAPKQERGNVVPGETGKKTETKTPAKTVTKGEAPKKDDDEDDDQEFPGKIKSVDPSKRMLVITLLNGKDRSFLLSKEVKIIVKGKPSKEGLQNSMIKPGIPITVITDEGGRKVKEVEVAPAPARARKSG
jgi:hypothetical protein